MGKRKVWVGLLLALQILWVCWFPSPAQAFTDEQKLVNEVWRIVNQAYVDSSFNDQDWRLVRQRVLKQPLGDREAAYSTIQEMLASLGDPFTRFLKPAQYRSLQTSTVGELTGVGLQISLNPATGQLEVITPLEGSPAAQAGLQPHDQILKIDGISTTELALDEAAERMRGTTGTSVTLTIQRLGEDADLPFDVQLARDRIALNPVRAELRPQPDGKALGYIRLNQFNANAANEMVQALTALEEQRAERYILDLRSNPGGLLQSGIEIAQLWLDPGPIVYTVDRRGMQGGFNAYGSPLTHDPLVVLVNQGTASASEILAGALQDTQRAEVIGEKTFGKGSIQSLFNLPGGAGLAVTIAKYETPNHRDINKVGILPDQVVPLNSISRAQVGTEADTQYQAAVKALMADSVVAGAA